jgi:hypothetical protein
MAPDGRLADAGEIIECDPPRRLVGVSRLTYEIEPQAKYVKFTLTHEMARPNSKLIEAVSTGWPEILASLKSLLETGKALEGTDRWPEDL